MDGMAARSRRVLSLCGRLMNEVVSVFVFSLLDLMDAALCLAFKVIDFLAEGEWKPCYCSSSSAKEAIHGAAGGEILVSERGESKIVSLSSGVGGGGGGNVNKVRLDQVSDTLYTRPSILLEVSRSIKRLKRGKERAAKATTMFGVDSAVVEMLQGRMVGKQPHPIPRWSDCVCEDCTSWAWRGRKSLFVRVGGAKGLLDKPREDVLFIHGFVSSSAFWTETLFPNFSSSAKSTYRLLAVDLLGFGRSPKPSDSLYTLREHLDMIEQSVLDPYKVKSFHIVAHSLGCILALALAVKRPASVKSLTLLAPPYYPVPKGEQAAQYVMRRLAPRRVWPPITFGASVACWYEHITRAWYLLACKNHRFWELLTKIITRNRIRTFLFEGFFCHTHNAAWHTLHNIICGMAGKLDGYLDTVRDRLSCNVTIFHGEDDELIPVECSYSVQRRVRRAHVKVIKNKDHITIVVGRQRAFARELEEIWRKSSS
ncbi:hypothetical protein BT93_K1955 [Corymbia citriodora subsp. variegata]|nr:hypothetical protein BT93_K1955 [Corymbia citriodora subsp. variegata]